MDQRCVEGGRAWLLSVSWTCLSPGRSESWLPVNFPMLGRPGTEAQQTDSGTASSLDAGRAMACESQGVRWERSRVGGTGEEPHTCPLGRAVFLPFRQEMRPREVADLTQVTQPQTAEQLSNLRSWVRAVAECLLWAGHCAETFPCISSLHVTQGG